MSRILPHVAGYEAGREVVATVARMFCLNAESSHDGTLSRAERG